MRPSPCLVAAFLLWSLAAPRALAQNATADGIDALIRNDPAGAARILTPLAESSAPANPVARFFIAALAETGFVPSDVLDPGCLYASVADVPTPLAAPARARLDALRRDDPDAARRCDHETGDVAGARAPASTPTGVAGGDTRAGVAAFVAGDYPAAAAILKPLAERHRRLGVDYAATLFTAAMYQSGIGLPRDPLRACALYMRFGLTYADVGTWLQELNLNLSRGTYSELPVGERGVCDLLSMIGFEHRFEPATFSLGPEHSVMFALSHGIEATVTYRGRERHESVWGDRADGLIFLPLRYTELPARPPAVGSRHFIELMAWVPISDMSWRLAWDLIEIVGESAVNVAREEAILSADGDAPNHPLDLRSLVEVRNDDLGRAEWAILTGPKARSELIPTQAELSEIRAERDARERRKLAAPPRKPLAFPRSPAFSYADAEGCGNIFAFTTSADGAEVLTIRVDRDALYLSPSAPRTFDLSASGPDLKVEVRVANRSRYDWGLCTDGRSLALDDADETWRAVSGTLTIQMTAPGLRVSAPALYRASLRLSDAEFVGPAGARVRLARPVTMTVWAGSFGG